MELFIGTIFSLELSMIGSCHFYNPFLAFPIPLKLLGVGKTGCVRPPLGAICLGFYYKALENPHYSPMEKHLEC